jgi:glycosyltransferase involved in cell wall biosynthesis
MVAIYNSMDVFVLPSYREGFSRVILEASACGLPIVTTDVRGCRTAVIPQQNSLLVPVHRPQDLAEAIKKLLLDENLREKMSVSSRKHAEENFDQNPILEYTIKTYEHFIANVRKGER